MRLRGDRGSSALFFVILAPALLALLGLVLDGGRAIFDRQQAGDVALQAARLAADQCDQAALYQHGFCQVVDTAAACAQAGDFVAQQEPVGKSVESGVRLQMTNCSPIDQQPGSNAYLGFRITVQAKAPTTLISIIGIDEINVQSTQSARSITQDG
jgi:hypothetical protein